MKPPTCRSNQPTGNCKHPGWRHATSEDEIRNTVKAEVVYTIEGAKVVGVSQYHSKTGVSDVVDLELEGGHQLGKSRMMRMAHPYFGFILINDIPPVTSEEVDEVLASIQTAVERLEDAP